MNVFVLKKILDNNEILYAKAGLTFSKKSGKGWVGKGIFKQALACRGYNFGSWQMSNEECFKTYYEWETSHGRYGLFVVDMCVDTGVVKQTDLLEWYYANMVKL